MYLLLLLLLQSKFKKNHTHCFLSLCQKEGLKGEEEVSQELRLLPPAHCRLMPFEVKPAPTPVRVDVALINYKENVKRKVVSIECL